MSIAQPNPFRAIALKVDSEVGEVSGLIGLDMPEDAFAEALAASRCAAAHLGLAGFDDGLVREGLERQLAQFQDLFQYSTIVLSGKVAPTNNR